MLKLLEAEWSDSLLTPHPRFPNHEVELSELRREGLADQNLAVVVSSKM